MIRFPHLRLSVAVAVVLAVVAAPASATAAETYVPIGGSGSTWSQNALDQWRTNVKNNYAMTVNYSGTGSSAGRRDFINGTVDFAVSEIPFQSRPEDGSSPENPGRGFAYMPIVAGGTALMYNLKIGGQRVTDLRLSGELIARIFTGQITKWNDPAIQAENPNLVMPDRAITPVVRSDGSGSTAQFTLWMSKQHGGIWGRPMTSQFPLITPAFKGQSGSLGVAGYVSQNYGEGAITYVEYSYAMKSGFPVAKVLNASGNYVEPTAGAVAVALKRARINEDAGSADYLTQILDDVYNDGDPRSYPLSSYSYMIVPTEVKGIFTSEKGKTLGTFAEYMLCTGQQQAAALGYSPLPMNLVQAGFQQVKRIPGSAVQDFDAARCANPNNELAENAPQPGEGGAGPGADGGGAAAAGGDAAAAAAAAGTAGGEVLYDADGNVISGSAAGGTAKSVAFEMPASAGSPAQVGMWVAAVLLVLGLLVPPVLLRAVRASRAR